MSQITLPPRKLLTDDEVQESAGHHGTDPAHERLVLSGFPETVFLLHLPHLGSDKYAANNATEATEKIDVNGLACFTSPDEIEVYKKDVAPQFAQGVNQKKSFAEARDIAIAKSQNTPPIKALFLWHNGGHIVEVFYVA